MVAINKNIETPLIYLFSMNGAGEDDKKEWATDEIRNKAKEANMDKNYIDYVKKYFR